MSAGVITQGIGPGGTIPLYITGGYAIGDEVAAAIPGYATVTGVVYGASVSGVTSGASVSGSVSGATLTGTHSGSNP